MTYEILKRLLSDKPVAFHPELARMFGGVNEALFFQQVAFWSDKGRDPEWIWKTAVDFEREICLSRYQQAKAREVLVGLGVIEEKRDGMPAKLWYRVNWDQVFRMMELRNQDLQFLQDKDARNSQPRSRGTATHDAQGAASRSRETSDHDPKELHDITESTTQNNSQTTRTWSPEELDRWEAEQEEYRRLRKAMER